MKYIFIVVLILFIWACFIEPNILAVKRITINCEELKGKRLVFASDFHFKPYESIRLEKLVRKINGENPDIVLFGGDYVNGHGKSNTMPIEEIAHGLGKIKGPKVGIIGNHDGWQGKEQIITALEKNDIKILVNESIKVENFYIAGLDDIQTGHPDINKTLKNTHSPVILLTHSPDVFPNLHSDDIKLTLAGHLHGGQVVFPPFKPLVVPSMYGTRYVHGLIEEEGKFLFVTKGLGTSIVPFRFNSKPEIVVVDFR